MRISKRLLVTAAAAVAMTVAGLTPVAANAAAAPADESVTSIVQNADGTVSETTYTPAPGVSPADLVKRLRSQGVDARAGTRTAGLAAASACSRGTARTWPSSATCFVRWSYNGAVRPVVDFVDSSGASWPVGRAVTKWNETSGIDSIYRTSGEGCDGAPAHCVHVSSYNYGPTGWTGLTSRTLNSAQTYYTQAVTELNDYYGGTQAQKWNTACHELGHVLGLDHNTSTSSCLYGSRTSQQYPNADDYNLLESYY